MTVAQLIEELQKIDPSMVMILQKDGEGNNYSPLSGVDYAGLVYVADTTYSGEVLPEQDYEGEPPCVVLFPVN